MNYFILFEWIALLFWFEKKSSLSPWRLRSFDISRKSMFWAPSLKYAITLVRSSLVKLAPEVSQAYSNTCLETTPEWLESAFVSFLYMFFHSYPIFALMFSLPTCRICYRLDRFEPVLTFVTDVFSSVFLLNLVGVLFFEVSSMSKADLNYFNYSKGLFDLIGPLKIS